MRALPTRCAHRALQVVVALPFVLRHEKYDRLVKKRTKLKAHDEYELCKEGDIVALQTSRQLSKEKSHIVKAIVQREDGSEPPDPFPNA